MSCIDADDPPTADGRTVADAMIRFPKLTDPTTTVGQARDALSNDHVHALLIVERGVLLTVVERTDLVTTAPDMLARQIGGLAGRVIAPGARLEAVHRAMAGAGRRRLAVVDEDGRLLGLLCLKRSHGGFCTDADVRARAAEFHPAGEYRGAPPSRRRPDESLAE